MTNRKTFFESLSMGASNTAAALTLFDDLDAVELDFMLGSWAGASFPTGHPLDGLLEVYHWHGKRFDSPEDGHPLRFRSRSGRVLSVDPLWMLPFLPLLRSRRVPKFAVGGKLFQYCIPLFATGRPRACLRLMDYRMIYDNLPINDIFRRIDDQTVLGLMDLRGLKTPFFFVLRRESER